MIALLNAALLAASLSLASNVDPFVGTSGTPVGGPIDTFPGADMPFGMVQWSPDTPSQNAGGGYEYSDSSITGFSLTHLSGPGCSVFGDFAMLPVVSDATQPAVTPQPFAHSSEVAAPGYYAVTLGTQPVRAELTVTDRTGLGAFTFPATTHADIVVNPASNQAGVTDASIAIVGNDEIEASASSGFFCGMPDRYTVYEVVRFDRPFRASGVEHGGRGPQALAWVQFDTTKDPLVRAQVALSFVDERGARTNLAAEARSWDIDTVRNAALAAWERMLNRVRVRGGTSSDRRQFYTALYHAMLHPNLISDADGRYRGFDGAVHEVRPGHAEYANYSDWDIYRTQIPLIALLAPHRTSDIEQSLVDAYTQSGWLPRWALVNQPTSVMGGDSVDAVIAGGYAFGARDFDVRTALQAMVKGATDTTSPPGYGWYLERPESADYQRLGYIPNTHTTSVSPVPNGASETLEYALDDASIASFARALNERALYERFLKRGANWANLFDTSTGWIAPRDESGAFEDTPITESGQSGFQEGNGAQYTWMVPQDLPALVAGMGGPAAAAAKLDTFFSQLNADQDKPYAWMGNEPSIGSPWAYLSAGEPWREQAVVRDVMTTLYADRPDGIPGNDDLGTMSAWWVWCAMGLYPQFTAERYVDVGTPLFSHVEIDPPLGPRITIDAPGASDATPYIAAARLNGRSLAHSWIALPLHGSVRLDLTVAAQPNRSWASAPDDAPPAFAPAQVTFAPSTDERISVATPSVDLAVGRSATIAVTTSGHDAGTVLTAESEPGLRATLSGTALQVTAQQPGLYNVRITGRASNGAILQSATVVVRAGNTLALAWIANRFDNTVMPYDPRTNALGMPVAVGEEPRDGVLTPDNRLYFVADRSAKSVSVVDTERAKMIADVAVGNSPNGTAISPDGRTVWIANYDDNTIQPIDVRTLRAGAPIAVGTGPRYIAVAPDGARLYVSDQGQNDVSVVDLHAMKVISEIPAGERPTGLALSPDGTRLYVANNGTQDVTVIDTRTNALVARIPAGVEAQMVAVRPDGAFAYVPNFSSNTLTPIDLTANTARPDVVVGGQPFDVEWLRDGSAALVTLRRDNALVRVDRAGAVGTPLFLGAGGAYTIAIPH